MCDIFLGKQQLTMANIDQGGQRTGAVQQEIAMRRLDRAVTKMMNVQVGVELDYQDLVAKC